MNAEGMVFVLNGVSASLNMPFFETDDRINQDEIAFTRQALSAMITTLKNAPLDRVEAMVAKYNDELNTHLDSFHSEQAKDLLVAFKEAQIMTGFVTTVMAKSGLRG